MLISQLCPTLCIPMDCSLPGSSVHRILQRILELIATPSSRGSSQPGDQIHVSCIVGEFFTNRATKEAINSILTSATFLRTVICIYIFCLSSHYSRLNNFALIEYQGSSWIHICLFLFPLSASLHSTFLST